MPTSNCSFVFAVVGDRHVAAVATALKFLKKFTRADILVIQSRSFLRAPHDQVIDVELPNTLDDKQASILIKTSVGSYVSGSAKCFCYLDSDVIAVSETIDAIFKMRFGAINFAVDHVNIDRFSRWSVKCKCTGGSCGHLRQAIRDTLNVDIPDGGWPMWNGGVFLFDESSAEFLDTWHKMTAQILCDAYWKTRDQGTLAATAWKLGYQDQKLLDPEFNLVVDRWWGIQEERRPYSIASDFHRRDDYSLTGEPYKLKPRFVHFINGGVGQVGWKNWDEVEALLCPE